MNEGAGPSFTPLARTICTESTNMSRIGAQLCRVSSGNRSAHYCSLRIPPVTALHIMS